MVSIILIMIRRIIIEIIEEVIIIRRNKNNISNRELSFYKLSNMSMKSKCQI